MQAIAHRGASAHAPENTRAAFQLAIEMGADGIETDVQITRDGELVLFHDDLVDRTSNGTGPLADHTLLELRERDLGGWFDKRFAGEQIVTLDELWTGFLPRIPICLEIKDPLATAPLLYWLSVRTLDHRVQVTSFSWSAVLQARAALDLPVGFLCTQFSTDIIERCVARGIDQICPPVAQLTSDLVEFAHQRGRVVRAWGVKQRVDIDRLFDTGADGATSNWPEWITGHPGYAPKGVM